MQKEILRFYIKYDNLPRILSRMIPVACICSILIIALIFWGLGEAKLAQKGLIVIAFPIILASILALWKFELLEENEFDNSPEFHIKFINFVNQILLFVGIYLVSLFVLSLHQTRSLDYFLLVSSMAGIILLEIVSLSQQLNNKIFIILMQIILLFLNMSFGCTLKYPMVILGTDIFYHMGYIKTIIDLGHVNSAMEFYQYFPLFHIFNFIGFSLTGMDLKNSYFILSGLSFTVSILLVYLLVNSAIKEPNISLLAALIYSFCRPVILGGMYGVTRTMGFLFCLLILYQLIKGRINIQSQSITIFLILPLVLVHQATLILFNVILVLFFAVERVLNQSYHFRVKYIFLFTVSYIAYWIFYCVPFFRSVLSTLFLTVEPVFIPEELKITSLASNIINYIDYGILIFTGIIGVIFLFNQSEKTNDSTKDTLALGSLILLPLLLPAIADLFSPLLGYRIPLQVSPLIVFISSAGVSIFLFQWKKRIKYKKFTSIFTILILLGFFLLSSTLSAKQIDYDMLPNLLGKENRGYFTQSELDSSSFLLDHRARNSIIISDYLMFRYLNGYLRLDSSSASAVIDEISPNSYFLLRFWEYQSSGRLDFIIEGSNLGFIGELLKTLKIAESPYPIYAWTSRSKVYSNGIVNIYRNDF